MLIPTVDIHGLWWSGRILRGNGAKPWSRTFSNSNNLILLENKQ